MSNKTSTPNQLSIVISNLLTLDTLVTKFKMNATLAGNVSDCIAIDGSGDIVKNMVGDLVYQSIDSLNSTYSYLSSIDLSLVNLIAVAHTSMLGNITAVKTAQIADITDQNSLNELINLSKASSYSCTSTGFTSDSWIPSISQTTTYVPCQVDGSNSDSSTCTSSSNFNSRAQGCTGCMDTYDLFKSNLTYLNVKTALTSRYPDLSCSTFNT